MKITCAIIEEGVKHLDSRFLNLGFDYAFDANRGLALDLNFMREQFTSNSSEGTDKGVYNYDNNRSDYALTYYGLSLIHI